jgi:hypothetical protein
MLPNFVGYLNHYLFLLGQQLATQIFLSPTRSPLANRPTSPPAGLLPRQHWSSSPPALAIGSSTALPTPFPARRVLPSASPLPGAGHPARWVLPVTYEFFPAAVGGLQALSRHRWCPASVLRWGCGLPLLVGGRPFPFPTSDDGRVFHGDKGTKRMTCGVPRVILCQDGFGWSK